jgi:transaldolase
MIAIETLHNLGQSLWLHNATPDLLKSGVLKNYIDELSLTGLTSDPTNFIPALKDDGTYDEAIVKKLKRGRVAEELFFELALEYLTQAADLFRPIFDRTNGVDGWVSLKLSPLLAQNTAGILTAAKNLYARGKRPNILIQIPGTSEGLPAVEEAIFAGVPVNVTLLFSREHYLAAADAYLRGIERRIAAGLKPDVGSVASVFVSRWDATVADRLPRVLENQLGIAMARRTYKACRNLLTSPRWQSIYNVGGRPQRLLWDNTGTKDTQASHLFYIKALAAPVTVNTLTETSLKALADSDFPAEIMPADGGDCEEVLAQFAKRGINVDVLAAQLQDEGMKLFLKSWNKLMAVINSKSSVLWKQV